MPISIRERKSVVDYNERLSLSYYKTVAVINEPHKVYLVQHLESGKLFVKKVLDVYSYDVYRFLKEHPQYGIPSIIDFYEEDDSLIVIEEYVTGSTLTELIESRTLTLDRLISCISSLCDILANLHGLTPPLIHRDIKPSNIMITGSGAVMLLDFNAAKFHSGDTHRESDTVLLGTPGYAAPEQFGFGESTPQTDIYSIGITIKEVAASMRETSNELDTVIARCTQMDPQRRYESVRELKAALEKLSNKANPSKRPAFLSYLPPGFRTLTFWKMLIAIPVYLFIFKLCLNLEVKDTGIADLWTERIAVLLIMLGDVLIVSNYRGIQNVFPLCRSENIAVRILGILLFAVLFTVATFILLIFAVNIIFYHR